MSIEKEGCQILDQQTEMNHEAQKKLKIAYTRDFLLSLSELDVCKKLPSGFEGFDQSLICEIEDASQDRQRITGGLSLHSFRRNEYGSSPPTRGDLGSYSRGIHGRWDSRSTGRSDRDSDAQSDWDSDSGRRYGNQSRRSWQVPEHDGLLGSGSFPRPSGYAAGASAPKFRANDQYQLNKSNEPYHPPRPYKAVPHSRRETNDSLNDETFGSSEFSDEDRAEEERKRRVSFELMRKEQQKAFQEKQLNPEKRKDDFDIMASLGDSKDDKGLLSRSNELGEPGILPASNNDADKRSLPSQTPASRPLVPPGFTSTILGRNFGTKTSVHPHSSEVGNPELEGSNLRARGNHVLNGNFDKQEDKHSAEQMGLSEQRQERTSIDVLVNNKSGKILDLSSALDASSEMVDMDSHLYKTSNLSEAFEASEDSELIEIDTEKVTGNKIVGESNQVHSTSILDKLFSNPLTVNGGDSSSFIEHHDSKADDTWSPQGPHTVQSSKFAHWFLEEEKKPVDDLSSGRPNDLLSLIVGGEKNGLQVSDVKATKHIPSEFPFQSSESVERHIESDLISASVENSEQSCNINTNKPAALPAVLTCEDLEQSILSEISEKEPALQPPVHGWSVPDAKAEQEKSDIDDRASQHLLSLLQKGTGLKDMAPSPNLDIRSSDKLHNIEVANIGATLHNSREANADQVPDSGKTLTLETLFGTAFMMELQSVGAPVSAHRGSVGSSRVDVSESHGVPFPLIDDGHLPSTVEIVPNRTSYENSILASNQKERIKSDGIEGHLLGFDDPRTEVNSSQLRTELGAKLGGFDRSAEVRLPEEDSLIAVSDPVPLQNFMPVRNSAKAELLSSSDTPVGIAEKLAALNSVFRDERAIVGGQEGPPFFRGHRDVREPDIPFHNLHVQSSSPQLHPPQLNHTGPLFHPLDSHPVNINYQLKFMAPEGIIHHDPPTNHQFPANMLRPPFHHPSSGLTGYDPPPSHPPMLQQMHMPGNFPPPHLLRGFPGGAPLPPHSNNQVTGFMQEANPMQGFPFGHRQPNFAGLGIPPSASDVGGGSNHPEAFQRLIEMEHRSNPKQVHPFAAAGQSQGMYGHELDMGFGYR